MTLPRIRQAVIAVSDLDSVVSRLRSELGLGEPYADPGVAYFGLCNAVFALGDTFLEMVSPVQANTAAGRRIERAGGDCGYMVMFQVQDLGAARARARELDVREVFGVELDDIAEVHLHPGDIGGAIVSVSTPEPVSGWRWGGPGWERRSAPPLVAGVTVAVADPERVRERWRAVLGGLPGVSFVQDGSEPGVVEIRISGGDARDPIDLGKVRLVPDR